MVISSYLRQTYAEKKVFVTGHTGFKGAWLISWLTLLGAQVKGYALPPEARSLYTDINANNLCQSVLADIRDEIRLKDEIIDFQPDFVFHLAAQPLVRRSYQVPTETFEINVMGTVNVLNTIRYIEKKCSVVLITTDKVYQNKEWYYPYRESDRLGGYDPYSASKAASELVISSYRDSYFNPANFSEHLKAIAVARAGNVIGGGDWATDRIIPDIVNSLSNHQTINIRNPHAIRPWQHVLEPLAGYLILGAKLSQDAMRYGTAWNFGPYPKDSLTVEELVRLAINYWGNGEYTVANDGPQPHEAGLLMLDISKAVNELGWKPYHTASEAIQLTIDWYKKIQMEPHRAEEVTTHQIKNYMTICGKSY